MKTHKPAYLIILILLLNACGTPPPPPASITLESEQTGNSEPSSIPKNHIKLPVSSHWSTWQCREGNFDIRYSDAGKHRLQIRYLGGEHILEQRPGDNPATYENNRLAFHSDGQTAVLARPASATIILSGCRP